MKIEKLKSGSYRIRKQYEGKKYAIVLDHKPTVKEANKLMALKTGEYWNQNIARMTFEEAIDRYITLKDNILSPSTIRAYKGMKFPQWFLNKRIDSIDQSDLQRMVNELSEKKSPKTVSNYHGFASAVITLQRPNMKIYTTLPKKHEKEAYTPSEEDVKKLSQYFEGTKYEIPLKLALFGLRRSEIYGLTPDDLRGDYVYIHSAVVKNANEEWVRKEMPKTDASIRMVQISPELCDLIKEKGCVTVGTPAAFTSAFVKAVNHLGLPEFSMHKLRYFFASQCHAMGFPNKYTQSMGGWKTDYTMKKVYIREMEEKRKETDRKYVEKISKLL